MPTRTSTPLRKSVTKKKRSAGLHADRSSKELEHLFAQGLTMNDREFELFVRVRARDCYWRLLAARARVQLDAQLEENRQLHELLGQLSKENEQLQVKSEQCDYLSSVFSSMMSDCDSGVELHTTGESPASDRRKLPSMPNENNT